MITFFFGILILLIIGVLEGAGLIALLVFLAIGAIIVCSTSKKKDNNVNNGGK